MITNLTISYSVGYINVVLSTDTDGENLPYNLADIFAKVIKESMANPEMVIEDLKTMIEYD